MHPPDPGRLHTELQAAHAMDVGGVGVASSIECQDHAMSLFGGATPVFGVDTDVAAPMDACRHSATGEARIQPASDSSNDFMS